jgi:NAD(P)-dependent dehydrogenase (short-subunit alcohol dehydrogenase family)
MASYVWFITASSSGFGKSIAFEALARGHKVIATARDPSSMTLLREKGAAAMSLDVNASEGSLAAKLQEASEIHGKITHVVNPAGYILADAVEEAAQAEVLNQYSTNVFGVANIARAAAPHLRASVKEGSGPVAYAAFGSLGSYRSGAAIAHYCSTKAAVSFLTEGLAEEWAPFGISVCCVEPGYTRTEFLSVEGGK